MGSTLRFQGLPDGQTPRFKPQQNFPPLAKWPPKIPRPTARDDFETNWEAESLPPQLVYNDAPAVDIETDDFSRDIYSIDEKYSPETVAIPEDTPAVPNLSTSDGEDNATDNVFEEESLAPIVSTGPDTRELEDDPDLIEESQVDSLPETTEIPPWFDKQPVSESHFNTGAPVIISPDASIPSPNLQSN